MTILAFYSIKGGVGKTAAAVNLAYLSSRDGYKTLLCDLDPQGSASYYFRVRTPKKFNSEKLLEGGKKVDRTIRGSDYTNLDILPADFSYRLLDIALSNRKRSTKWLKEVLTPFEDEYDHIFIDCPPNITLLSENVFFAADYILLPFVPTTLSRLTYDKLLKFFNKSKLDQSGIVPFFSMVEQQKTVHKEIISEMEGDKHFLKSQVPYAADIEKMGIYRKPVACTQARSKATASFEELWNELKEIISRD
jgi:cellulose biosynthesis protein BcsQ